MKRQQKFSRVLKQARLGKQLSFRALGKLLKVSATILVHYESGISYPTSKILERLCGVFSWDFKSTYLLIQNEKSPEKTLARHFHVVKPEYPELRKILLDLYNLQFILASDPNSVFDQNVAVKVLESLNLVTKDEMKQELEKYPVHFVETTLATSVLRISQHKDEELPQQMVLNYFQNLKNEEREAQIKKVIDAWAYDITNHRLLAHLKIVNEKGEAKYILRMYSLKFVAIAEGKETASRLKQIPSSEKKKVSKNTA